jgi:2-hydroxychromene-2-carboxylate isomerase
MRAIDTPRSLEFWYEFGSNYSYLSVMRIDALAEQYGVQIIWKPFLLGPIFKSFGWASSPFVLQKEKGTYTWQDMARQCEKYHLPWKKPSNFPRSALLPMRVAMLGADQPWLGKYNKQMMQINFVEDHDIDGPEAVGKVLSELELPAASIIAEAQSEANKLRLRAQTDDARQRGIFGAPTFFVGTEMFWGNDRLEDALLLAAEAKP